IEKNIIQVPIVFNVTNTFLIISACKSGYGVCDRAVMSQPNIPAKWNPRTLDCCIDRRSVSLCGTFCSMCLACQMVERYGECLSPPGSPVSKIYRYIAREMKRLLG
uniref:Uncharacterized protein n=1 Tax=Oncorhynchus tshawytscha TaxID=74940 RepID=A0A8C8GWK3_ONCTS